MPTEEKNIGTGALSGKLMVFTRYPEVGRVKTRMIPRVGAAGAARVHAEMAIWAVTRARETVSGGTFEVEAEVHFAGGSEDSMREWLGHGIRLVPQRDGDLGERMSAAFDGAFQAGAKRAVIIGTDCPDLDVFALERAFALLGVSDVVLGPAADGGYYLIGLARPDRRLFDGIPWGSGEVLESTKRRARSLNLTVAVLPVLADVDRPEDLAVWEAARDLNPVERAGRISVVIPVLNEAGGIAAAVASACAADNVEVVVVDGGSRDGTPVIANRAGATVVHGTRGRGSQMNTGASVATGEYLLFLHADTRLPQGYARVVRETLEVPGNAGGAFRLRIDGSGILLRITEWAANFRSCVFELPYGDQAVFTRRDDFSAVGGFPAWPLLEDVGFVRSLSRRGRTMVAATSVLSSARRWRRLGVLRNWAINQAVIIGFFAGIKVESLARMYYGGREKVPVPMHQEAK